MKVYIILVVCRVIVRTVVCSPARNPGYHVVTHVERSVTPWRIVPQLTVNSQGCSNVHVVIGRKRYSAI